MYRRLLAFLRPHAWRMAVTIVCNIGAALLDVFAFTLLIPFLDKLFNRPQANSELAKFQERLLGDLIGAGPPMEGLRNIILIIIAAVTLKNLLVWLGGQSAAAVQEYVTRDLRNTVYSHLQRLPLA